MAVASGESPLPDEKCLTTALCSEPEPVPPPGARNAPQVQPGPEPALGEIGSFMAGVAAAVGHATEEAVDATVAVLLQGGTAVWGALRAYADFLLSYKPAMMDAPAYAAVAASATAVALGSTQAGLWYLARKLKPLLAALGLFSRIEKDELLENDRRARIYELIKENPGLRLGEIGRSLGMPWGSCLHHLRKLRSERLIMFKSVGHHKCFFVNGCGLSQKQMEAASVVKGDTLEKIAAFIGTHPRTNLKDLARAVQITSPLAAFHVKKLERAGLVLKTRDGKSVRLEPVRMGPFLTSGPSPVAVSS